MTCSALAAASGQKGFADSIDLFADLLCFSIEHHIWCIFGAFQVPSPEKQIIVLRNTCSIDIDPTIKRRISTPNFRNFPMAYP